MQTLEALVPFQLPNFQMFTQGKQNVKRIHVDSIHFLKSSSKEPD
jgi:hypothetical protein